MRRRYHVEGFRVSVVISQVAAMSKVPTRIPSNMIREINELNILFGPILGTLEFEYGAENETVIGYDGDDVGVTRFHADAEVDCKTQGEIEAAVYLLREQGFTRVNDVNLLLAEVE